MKSQIIRTGIAVILAEVLILSAVTGQLSMVVSAIVAGLYLIFLQCMLIIHERLLKRSISNNIETLAGWQKTLDLGKKAVGVLNTHEQVGQAQQAYITELEVALQKVGVAWPGGREGLREVLRQANAKIKAN